MAQTPERKVCSCRQRGHADRGEGRVGEEKRNWFNSLDKDAPHLPTPTRVSSVPTLTGSTDCQEGCGGLCSDHPSGNPEPGHDCVSRQCQGEDTRVDSRSAELLAFCKGENRAAAGGS